MSLPDARIEIGARKAKLRITLSGVAVVRNSRFGDYLNSPYITTEIIESARKIQEQESGTQVRGEFGIIKGIFGKLTATFFSGKSRKSSLESDNLVKIALNAYRVVYRALDCWDVVEPVPPRVLTGKYLGETLSSRDGERTDPLCFLTFSKKGQHVDVWLSVDRSDLEFNLIDTKSLQPVSRNREAVIGELLRRSVSSNVLGVTPLSPQVNSNEIILGHSRMEAKNVD